MITRGLVNNTLITKGLGSTILDGLRGLREIVRFTARITTKAFFKSR